MIQYLPGTPEPFSKSFQVSVHQLIHCVILDIMIVAHFKPDTITLVGEGVFPSMSLNLPRLYPADDGIDMRMVEQSIVKQFAIENNNIITSAKLPGRRTFKPRYS